MDIVYDMPGVSKSGFNSLRPLCKAAYKGFLLAFIIGVLEADFIGNPSSTWYDGYITCRQHGQTMLNWLMPMDSVSNLQIAYPLWVNGFEARVNNKNINYGFGQVQSNQAAFVRCVNSTAFVDENTILGFEEGRIYCQNQFDGSHMDLPLVNHTNLHMFTVPTGKPYWTKALEVGQFLNSEDLTVHCFVLKDIGDLRKDNCTKRYSSICVNATLHDIIHYTGQESRVPHYDPTSSGTHVKLSAFTSEFVTSLVTSETYTGVDLTTSAANTTFYLNDSTSDPKTDENAMASSIIILVSTTLGPCLLALIVIVACMCLKRKHGFVTTLVFTPNTSNNTRNSFQQNELVQQSNVPQEGHSDNSDYYDVIPDDITEQEATLYTSLQMTEKHLYTALAVRLENNDDEPDNDSPIETNYTDVEVQENDGPGQTNTDSEAKIVLCCC